VSRREPAQPSPSETAGSFIDGRIRPRMPDRLPARLPPHGPGMRIGLFGGTFNPPHQGHLLVSRIALDRLGLDRIWWIVTPGNPLKENSGLPPLELRMEAARKLARHPRIDITGFEAEIGTRYTYDTIAYLSQRCPQVDFVWIMGADNLRQFHRWQRWQDMARLAPIAVIDRPGSTLKAANSRAAVWLSRRRFDEREARLLAGAEAPAFIFLHGPRSELSSTELRQAGADLSTGTDLSGGPDLRQAGHVV
jgi:nicotinate-nucleotide adenylyltransferase